MRIRTKKSQIFWLYYRRKRRYYGGSQQNQSYTSLGKTDYNTWGPRFSKLRQLLPIIYFEICRHRPIFNFLTKKDSVFEFSKKCQKVFNTLKTALIHAFVLFAFDPTRPIRVKADSFGYAIGGVLSQLNEKGRWRPIAFYSRKILPTECNYFIHNKKLFSIIKCLPKWQFELRSVN
jgi:hypothetical protein